MQMRIIIRHIDNFENLNKDKKRENKALYTFEEKSFPNVT
jgi:hypothetical protein